MYIVVEKVFDTLIPYSTNSLCQVMENTLNVTCSYFHINMCETNYPVMGGSTSYHS